MDAIVKEKWHVVQTHISQLLSQWMELIRHPELFENSLLRDPLSLPLLTILLLSKIPLLGSVSHYSRTAINQWGRALTDYILIFQFCPDAQATRIRTWSHALAMFTQNGGDLSSFLDECQFIGMVTCMVRLLPCSHLKDHEGWDADSA